VKILVTVKRVPDPEQKLKFSNGGLDLSAANWVLNAFDEYAVEAALRLTEKVAGGATERVGEVVVLAIGPKEVSQQLRSCLAMGAERALHVVADEATLDASLVARILKKVVVDEKPDLVLMGKLAVDGEEGQVGQMAAGLLGWPQACFACSIDVADGGEALLVGREVDAGVEQKRVALPALVTVDLRIIQPTAVKNGLTPADHAYAEGARYASLKGIMAAKKKELRELALSSLGVDAALRTKTVTVEPPAARKAGVKVASVEELVAKLRNEAKVL
jgi:electron transfer flavoprotein beta subunit